MKEFFKDYFLSYFSHNSSKNIFKRSFLITFINVIVVLLSLIFSLYFGDQISFSYCYDNSSNFQEVLSEVFSNDFSVNENNIDLDFTYNSYAEDPNNYKQYNYEVIIDSRDKATTFEDFTFTMSNDDSTSVISYEEYLLLEEDKKEDYHVVLTHTGLVLDTIANISKYETYLNSLEDKSSFNELKTKYDNGEISNLEYANQLYILYGNSYYPEDIYDSDSYGKMPTLHSYYRTCLNNDYTNNDYIFIYQNGIEASFKTDNGKQTTYLGQFLINKEYKISSNKEEAIKEFILDSFNGGNDYRLIENLLISFYVWFALIIVFVIVTLIFRLILKKINPEATVYYLKLLNLEGSYMLFSTFITFIYTLIASFFMFKFSVIVSSIIILFLLVLIRTIFFFIKEKNFDDSVKDE